MEFGISINVAEIYKCNCDWASVIKADILEKFKTNPKTNKKTIEKHMKQLQDQQSTLFVAVCIDSVS